MNLDNKNNMLSVKILREMDACSEAIEEFEERFGEREWSIEDIIKKNKEDGFVPSEGDVSWLIINCNYCQTPEMIKYFKSLNPDVDDVSWLIASCEYCQTPEIKNILVEE